MLSHTPAVLPDTNFLIEYPKIHEEPWSLRPLQILISDVVVAELAGLCKNEYPLLAENAQRALDVLKILRKQAQNGHGVYKQGDLAISFIPRPTHVAPPLEAKTPDHQLIATARSRLTAVPPHFCAILSNDRELCHIAEALSAITVIPAERGDPARFHEELQRKYEWWSKTRQEIPLPPPRRPLRLDPQARFERRIKRLHSQARAARYRTIFSLAPLTARLGLATRIIQQVRNPQKRVVLVVVDSTATAEYWAAEMRRAGDFKDGDIQIFGMDSLGRLEKARAIIYHYGQMARRLPHHMDRLKQEGQRLTAVVDGCDMVDPADLAPLLFDCDQFIGFNYRPDGAVHNSTNRMLDAYMRGRSILTFSFADAERDGWGHAHDFFPHPVAFTSDEQEIWAELNDQYLRRREMVVRQYPQLKSADNFWEKLGRVLVKAVAPEAAELFPLYERREQMTHQAFNKLAMVERLIQNTERQPYRRLILDYDRQWTPVLTKRLSSTGFQVAELISGVDQRQIWDGFAGNKLDTLLLSESPTFTLPNAHFHQLIIMTPLRPVPEISAITDWALSHTHAKDALRIDLLYVANSPEEVAMLEVAESCFNLRYTGK